jgi:hypothetical protein
MGNTEAATSPWEKPRVKYGVGVVPLDYLDLIVRLADRECGKCGNVNLRIKRVEIGPHAAELGCPACELRHVTWLPSGAMQSIVDSFPPYNLPRAPIVLAPTETGYTCTVESN